MRTFRVFWRRDTGGFTDFTADYFAARDDGLIWMYQNEGTGAVSKHRAVAAFPMDAIEGIVIPELVYQKPKPPVDLDQPCWPDTEEA